MTHFVVGMHGHVARRLPSIGLFGRLAHSIAFHTSNAWSVMIAFSPRRRFFLISVSVHLPSDGNLARVMSALHGVGHSIHLLQRRVRNTNGWCQFRFVVCGDFNVQLAGHNCNICPFGFGCKDPRSSCVATFAWQRKFRVASIFENDGNPSCFLPAEVLHARRVDWPHRLVRKRSTFGSQLGDAADDLLDAEDQPHRKARSHQKQVPGASANSMFDGNGHTFTMGYGGTGSFGPCGGLSWCPGYRQVVPWHVGARCFRSHTHLVQPGHLPF